MEKEPEFLSNTELIASLIGFLEEAKSLMKAQKELVKLQTTQIKDKEYFSRKEIYG